MYNNQERNVHEKNWQKKLLYIIWSDVACVFNLGPSAKNTSFAWQLDEVSALNQSVILLEQKLTEAEAARLDLISNK